MAKPNTTVKDRETARLALEVDAERWFNQIQKIKALIVTHEFNKEPITTQKLREVIQWESGKDYRSVSYGG